MKRCEKRTAPVQKNTRHTHIGAPFATSHSFGDVTFPKGSKGGGGGGGGGGKFIQSEDEEEEEESLFRAGG